MARLKAAIDGLSAPGPGENGEPDPRSASTRRHDALISLLSRHLDGGDLPRNHAVRPHLSITTTEAALRSEPGAAFGVASTGEELSPETVARLACDAEITAFLLSGAGAVLKMGRTVRTVTPQQWRALVVRDIGCQFYGCTVPAAWCAAHHLVWWRSGGPTDIDNLGLYCDFHHHVIHKQGWEARMGRDGRPVLIPPAWVDIERRPRVNLHWRAGPDFAADT